MKRLVLIATVVAVLAGVSCLFWFSEPVYKATALLRIETATPYLIYPTRETSLSAQRYAATQIALMRHSLVVGSAVRRPEIAALPEFEELAEEGERIAWVSQRLDFTNLQDSDLYELSIECAHAESAAFILNAVTEEYFDARQKEEAEKRPLVVDLLREEQARRATQIEQLWETVTELTKQVHGTTGITPNAVGDPGQAQTPLARLQTDLVNAEVDLEVLRAEFDAASQMASGEAASDDHITASGETIEKAVEQDRQVVILETVVRAAQAVLREHESRVDAPEKDASYLRMRDEIALMQESLEEFREELRQRFRVELQQASSTTPVDDLAGMQSSLRRQEYLIQALKGRLDDERKNAERTGGNEVELANRRNELTRAQGVHDRIAERILQLDVEYAASDRVTMLSEAKIPTAPVRQILPYKMAVIAMLVGFALPFVIVGACGRFATKAAVE